jgi:Zn-dependent protease
LPAIVGYSALARGGLFSAIDAVVFVLAIFGCVVLHELGHALAARRFGISTRDITLLPIGGIARLERMPRNPYQEFVIAVAGPAVNVVIAAALFTGLTFAGVTGIFDPALLLVQLMWANVALVLFNMLPAFPMDGGRVLRSVLAMRMSYERATNIAATIGQGLAIVFAVLGILASNISLLLVALFVFFAARGEAAMARSWSATPVVSVGEVMDRTFRSLPANATLEYAGHEMMFSDQRDFPVTYGGQLVGMLAKADALRALSQGFGHRPVSEFMRRDVPVVDQRSPVGETMNRMRMGNYSSVPVSRDGLLVGLLTFEKLSRWLGVLAPDRQRNGFAAHGCCA